MKKSNKTSIKYAKKYEMNVHPLLGKIYFGRIIFRDSHKGYKWFINTITETTRNFSSKPVYNNKFDEIFKKFLSERIKYINQVFFTAYTSG